MQQVMHISNIHLLLSAIHVLLRPNWFVSTLNSPRTPVELSTYWCNPRTVETQFIWQYVGLTKNPSWTVNVRVGAGVHGLPPRGIQPVPPLCVSMTDCSQWICWACPPCTCAPYWAPALVTFLEAESSALAAESFCTAGRMLLLVGVNTELGVERVPFLLIVVIVSWYVLMVGDVSAGCCAVAGGYLMTACALYWHLLGHQGHGPDNCTSITEYTYIYHYWVITGEKCQAWGVSSEFMFVCGTDQGSGHFIERPSWLLSVDSYVFIWHCFQRIPHTIHPGVEKWPALA